TLPSAIGAEADGELGFENVVPAAGRQRRSALVERSGENAAEERMREPNFGLHFLGGGADLPAERARARTPRQRVLDRDRLGEIARRGFGGQSVDEAAV